MTPTEIIEELAALGPQDFAVVLQFLADHVYVAKLLDGTRLFDPVDFKTWLEELSVAAHARRAGLAGTTRPEQKRWSA